MTLSKGGKIDASGEFIKSVRLVVDSDADAGLGTAADPVRVDPTGTTVQPVSGTVTVGGITGTLDTNLKQVGANTVDSNSGLKSAGTLRVVLATDQPALTNKLLVTPDSVALPANQSVNQTQWNGTAVDVNSGVKSAGTLRVVLATDQPALTNKILVTPDSVALPANQSVNNAQINGVTPLMGNGVTGTGSQRVTIASDNTAFTVNSRITGNAGATVDSTVGAGTAPTNQVVVGTVANSAAPSPTAGQALALQSDLKGNLRVNSGTHTTARSTSTGAQQTITVPAATKYVLMGGYFELDCSATVATRQLILDIKDASGNVVATIVPSPTFTASQVGAMTFGPSLPAQSAAVLNNFTWPLPQLALGASFTVVTRVQNLQATDVVILNINVISTPA